MRHEVQRQQRQHCMALDLEALQLREQALRYCQVHADLSLWQMAANAELQLMLCESEHMGVVVALQQEEQAMQGGLQAAKVQLHEVCCAQNVGHCMLLPKSHLIPSQQKPERMAA